MIVCGHEGEKWNDPSNPALPPTRLAMGHTLTYANRMNLADMTPHNNLASTRYCLANSGTECLVYLPPFSLQDYRVLNWFSRLCDINYKRMPQYLYQSLGFKETITIDLSAASGKFQAEWFNPLTGEVTKGKIINGDTHPSLKALFIGEAVLCIYQSI